MHLPHTKEQAVQLRKKGFSYNHISKELKVAKSTLSIWLKAVPFVPNEITFQAIINGQKKISQAKRVDKVMSLAEASRYAKHKVGKLSERDFFMLGLGIYIGEGSKTHSLTRIVNADPRIIGFAVRWLKSSFGISNKNIRIRLHIYPDHNPNKAVEYWMNQLHLPRSVFQECYVDRRLNKKSKKVGVLPYGTAHLGVASCGDKDLGVLLHRKIIASIGLVLDRNTRD